MPVLQVEAQGAELLATPGDRTQRGVDGVYEGDRPGGCGVVRADRGSFTAQLRHRQSDAAGAFGDPHDVADRPSDVLQVVLGAHDEAVR